MTPWLDDGDVRVYLGDVRAVLAAMPDESVDCVITSPPYWGLRDYGTGAWDGGDPDCDHATVARWDGPKQTQGAQSGHASAADRLDRETCRCGARRVDQQFGLEPTPDAYVQNMVAVFREIRRVLARHGTCWLNLGDSYAGSWGAQSRGNTTGEDKTTLGGSSSLSARQIKEAPAFGSLTGARGVGDGIKPKDLVGIPWRVAFALQADGWWLRSEIIWAKPNPMPESVTDRPTKSHETVFLLSKRPVYFFDQEAVREPAIYPGEQLGVVRGTKRRASANGRGSEASGNESFARSYAVDAVTPAAGRNVRSVWEIATQPFPDAHFATYPEELVRRCLLAGCPAEVCRVCGKPRERIVEKHLVDAGSWSDQAGKKRADTRGAEVSPSSVFRTGMVNQAETVGWSDCGHNAYRPGRVLDPFLGSGTTALVARNHGRHAVGIELNEEYARIAARRLQQLSLLA